MNLACIRYRVDPSLLHDESVFVGKTGKEFTHPDTYEHYLKGSNRRHVEMLKNRIKDLLAVRPLTREAIKQITNGSRSQLAIAYKQLVAEGAIESFLTDDKVPVMKYRLVENA